MFWIHLGTRDYMSVRPVCYVVLCFSFRRAMNQLVVYPYTFQSYARVGIILDSQTDRWTNGLTHKTFIQPAYQWLAISCV